MLESLPIGTKEGAFDTGETLTILSKVRQKHMAIFGTAGAGKSTLLRNMIAWDIAAGTGVTVVDPHGGLVDDILDHHIPRHRINDVIYFDPGAKPICVGGLRSRRDVAIRKCDAWISTVLK